MNFIVENYFWISIAFIAVIILGIVVLVINRSSRKKPSMSSLRRDVLKLAKMGGELAKSGSERAAKAKFKIAIQLAKGIISTDTRSVIFANIAENQAYLNSLENSHESFNEAILLAKQCDSEDYCPQLLSMIAKKQAVSGLIKESKSTFNLANKFAKEISNAAEYIKILIIIGEEQEQAKDFINAKITFEKAKKATKNVSNKLNRDRFVSIIEEKLVILETKNTDGSLETLDRSIRPELGIKDIKNKKAASFAYLTDELINLIPKIRYKHKMLDTSKSALKIIKESQASPLLVVVLGEFSSGKSTFINALLKEQLLAMKVRPTTATITQLQYGEKPEMYVHYYDGKIEKKDLSDLNTFTVENYIKEENVLNNVYYVRLQLRNKFLEKIDIADTPGFNSTIERHTEITSEFIAHADIVFWLFDANQMLKGTEVNILEKYCKNFKPVAIINKVDTLSLNNNKTVMDELNSSIEKISDFVEKIFPVSATMALNSQNGEYEQSGMQDIVNYFHSDIIPNSRKTKERMAHIKFAQVAYNLDIVRKEIEKNIEKPKKEIENFKKQKIVLDDGLKNYSKSIMNWDTDCNSKKDAIWMIKNRQRYFLVNKVPSDINGESKAFIRTFSKLENDNKEIDNWSNSIERDSIIVDKMYDDINRKVKIYEEKGGGLKSFGDSIFEALFDEPFSDEKTEINSLIDEYEALVNNFNADVDNYNNFLKRTNEKWDELYNDALEFLNKYVLKSINSQAEDLKKLENELLAEEKYIKKIEKEYKILDSDIKLFNNIVSTIFNNFKELILDAEFNDTASVFTDFDSLIGHFKSISVDNSDLDWKSLYSRSKIQDLINNKKVKFSKTFTQGTKHFHENRTVNKV